MKVVSKFVFVLVAIICSSTLTTSAQNITGIWRGYFITDGTDQYKFEIQIEQSPKKNLSGVSYSYLTTVFYGKATLAGNLNRSTKSVLIQEIKTVDLRISGGSIACIMKCLLQYVKSGNEEFLEGSYTSKYEKTSEGYGIKKGQGCGGGKVFLRKVPTSDFYIEPFLRDNPVAKKKTTPDTKPVVKAPPAKTNPKPTVKAPVKKLPPPLEKTTAKKTPVRKTDTARKISPPVIAKTEPRKTVTAPRITIPATTRSRDNELVQTIIVANNQVSVRLYDNGEIDDDTVSVYLDNQLAVSNKRLTTTPINLTLNLSNESPEHVLVLVAENLGRIPPNTSLMIVQDGDKRYQVRITSTNQKNAMVRFKYQTP